MANDLSAYAALSKRLSGLGPDDDLRIAAADFPADLADHTPFDGLAFDTSFIHDFGWAGPDDRPFEIIDRVHGFNGFALAEGYRRFGLWLLHLLLSGRDWAGLELTHPISRARHVYASIQRPPSLFYGLQRQDVERFSAYLYMPQEVWRHPFAGPDMTPLPRIEGAQDRPFFAFGWSHEQDRQRWDISRADQIILEASPDGMAAMAALMIDMGHPVMGREEINMEVPDIGFAGTRPRSIEARFWLPGSLAFPGDKLDELYFPPFR